METKASKSELKISAAAGFIVALITAEFLVMAANYLLLHHDLWWHLAIGDWIRQNHKLPQHDFWSYTAGDQPFYLLSWLWDISAGWLFAKGGLNLLVILYIWLSALSFAGLALFCIKTSGSRIISMIMAVVSLLVIFPYALPDMPISVSPQCLGLYLSLLWLVLNFKLSATEKPVCLFSVLILLYLIWLNCHGGFVVAFTITGSFWLQSIFQRSPAGFKRFTLLGLLCLAASLINPLGLDIYQAVASTIFHPTKAYISEWQGFSFTAYWPASIYLLLAIISIVFPLKNLTGDKLLALRILSLFWLVVGLDEKRNLALFFIFSLPLICTMLSAVLPKLKTWEELFMMRLAKWGNALLGAVFIITLAGFIISWKLNYPAGLQVPSVIYPVEETAYLQTHFAPQRIYNHWNFGGYLIFATRGRYPVYIDGRAGTAYPDWLFAFDRKFNNELDKAEALYKLYGVKVALVRVYPPGGCGSKICGKWREIYRGKVAVIWQREE